MPRSNEAAALEIKRSRIRFLKARIAAGEDGADVAQVYERGGALWRALAIRRQFGGDSGQKTAKFGPRQAYQVGD